MYETKKMNTEQPITTKPDYSAPPRWKLYGVALGIYPFDWSLSIERFDTIMTTICVGPFVLTVHH